MADGLAIAEITAGSRGLTYPWPQAPAIGEAIQVAPGVLWMRLPLPMALNHVNVFALEDGEGWAIVDTGLRTPASVEGWEAALAGPLGGRPVTRVIGTHMHPDHIGLAGWLCERFDAPLLMTQLEYVTARMLLADTGPAPEDGAVFYRAAGWEQEDLDRYVERFGGFGKAVSQLPDAFRRLSDGQEISIGGRTWRIVTGCGHSPDHACLWQPELNVFISGDQILPRISSNVSVFPTEPEADPLSDWLDSCRKLKAAIPEGVRMVSAPPARSVIASSNVQCVGVPKRP